MASGSSDIASAWVGSWISICALRLRPSTLAFSLLSTLLCEPVLFEMELAELVDEDPEEFILCSTPGSVFLSMMCCGVPW